MTNYFQGTYFLMIGEDRIFERIREKVRSVITNYRQTIDFLANPMLIHESLHQQKHCQTSKVAFFTVDRILFIYFLTKNNTWVDGTFAAGAKTTPRQPAICRLSFI